MSFYQIWIRSFCDGNGDGIGDLYGVYDKLEYIKSLGVDGIWFSPIYPSPNADYGYDISDYKDIHPDYGTLDQFKKVLDRAHELGLKVLLDLVINHTSDEHPWFIESCKGKDNPYSDYYIWRDPHFKGEEKLPPTTGTASLRASPGSTTSREDSIICTSLQRSSPTSTWTIRRCARKSRTLCATGWIWALTASART